MADQSKTPKIKVPAASAPASLPQTAAEVVKGREPLKKVNIELPESLFWRVKTEAVQQRKKLRDIYHEALDCYFKQLDAQRNPPK